ncbi:hypothetical protein CSV66_12185 [Sporosarcina sp. P30]|nr:hypothetical protein CSV66_12185 [Sporosarcina sp. P30]
MDLPLTLSAKPQPPGLNRNRKSTCKNHNSVPLITYFKQKRNPTALQQVKTTTRTAIHPIQRRRLLW